LAINSRQHCAATPEGLDMCTNISAVA
jgi:hypothetical protein